MDLTNLFNLQTPQGSMMAGLASALGRAAMPSRMPVSLGAALGMGAGGMMQGYQQGLQNQAQAMKNKFTQERLNYINQMTGAPAAGTVSAPAGTPSGLLSAPVNTGGLLGYNQAADAAQTNPAAFTPASQATSTATSAPSYFNPRQLFNEGMMFNLMGLPGGSEMMSVAVSNDPTLAGQVALAKKGMVTGPNGQVSYAPGYINAQGALAGAQEKAKFPYDVASSALRYAGRNISASPTSNVYSGFSLLPPNIRNAIDQTISGVVGGPTTSPAAPAPNIPTRPIPAAGPGAVGGGVAPTISSTQVPAAPGGSTPAPVAGVSATPPARPGGVQPVVAGITPFQDTSQKMHASQLEKKSEALSNAADSAVTMNYNLDQMSQAVKGFTPGPGTNFQMFLEHNLAMLGKPFGIAPPKNLGSYQEFKKYSNQVAFAQTRLLGSREAAQVVQMQIESNPNAELNPEAALGLINSMHSMNDYIIAKSKAEQNWRASHDGTTNGFNQSWQSEYDPRTWEFPNMAPDAQQNFVKSLSPAQAKKFSAQLNNAYQAGYIQ